ILANLKGGDAVIIASAISRSAQQVSARPGITRREDLRGKRWGVLARNDADECSIVMAFERWGWELARDAEIVVVGLDGARLDLLLDPRRVDVAIMHAPEPFQAAKRGWTLVEDLGRLDVAFQNSCAVTTRRLLAAKPEISRRYVLFARLMGGVMFPSVEGMRNAIHVLHRLGVLRQPPEPQSYIDLELVGAAEREDFFSTFMGRPPA